MNQLDPSCPWGTWEPSTIEWCEQQICSVIREPANTWSNLGFVFVGIWMLWHCRNSKYGHLRLLGYFSILIGLMSGFYHASSSFIGEVFDYSAMFFISTYFICANLARMRDWTYRKLKIVATLVLIPSILLLIKFKIVGATLFGAQIAVSVLIELRLWKLSAQKPNYRPFLMTLACFLVAYGIWNLDRLKIVCAADFHWFSGHAAWHLLDAAALYFMYHFYSQFTLEEPSNKTV